MHTIIHVYANALLRYGLTHMHGRVIQQIKKKKKKFAWRGTYFRHGGMALHLGALEHSHQQL